MESFWIAFYAVLPFLLYLAFGAIARKTGAADKDFLNKLNTFVFKVFFPILMFKNVYWVGSGFTLNLHFVAFALISLFAVIAVLMLTVPRIVKENPRRGVIVQGIYRSNIVLFAIPLAENIYGSDSNFLATMLVAFVVPVYNAMAVIILEYFNGTTTSRLALLKKVAKNPLILGILTGILFRFFKIPIPDFLAQPAKLFADMATPLALFALGGTLTFSAVRHNALRILAVCSIKLIFLPIVIFTLASFMKFTPIEKFMLLIMYATPTAVSSFPMAQNMGGDGELAGQIVVFTTTFSMFTLFLFIFILKLLGLS